MKKLVKASVCTICAVLAVSAAVLANEYNVFDNFGLFKHKASQIDARLDNNLDNPEEYQKAMNESLELFNNPQYEKIENQIVQEQELSREYLKEYVADIKCALMDSKNGYGADDTTEILDKQIELYEKLEKVVEKADDNAIGDLSKQIKAATKSMKPGKEMPELTQELALLIEEI